MVVRIIDVDGVHLEPARAHTTHVIEVQAKNGFIFASIFICVLDDGNRHQYVQIHCWKSSGGGPKAVLPSAKLPKERKVNISTHDSF
jgi:hypothetical protein